MEGQGGALCQFCVVLCARSTKLLVVVVTYLEWCWESYQNICQVPSPIHDPCWLVILFSIMLPTIFPGPPITEWTDWRTAKTQAVRWDHRKCCALTEVWVCSLKNEPYKNIDVWKFWIYILEALSATQNGKTACLGETSPPCVLRSIIFAWLFS